MKEMGVFVFLVVFFFGVAAAADSSATTQFNVNGCSTDFNGDTISIAGGSCSSGDAYGYFFCDSGVPTNLLDTLQPSLGCTRGNTSYVLGSPEGACCPPGYICTDLGTGLFQCQRSLVDCTIDMDQTSCESVDGYFYDNGNGVADDCICNRGDQDCGVYVNETDCNADLIGVGSFGVGSEYCGSTITCDSQTFSIPSDQCGCSWDSSSGVCHLEMTATQTFYSGTPDKFECSSFYSLGNCEDGKQNVTWTSSSNIVSGFTSGSIPTECLDALECNGGEASRFCGTPVTKLPVFSVFSLFASLLLIGLYFFIDKKGGLKFNENF